LNDKDETIRRLVLFHVHRNAIEEVLGEWIQRGDRWARASLEFHEDGSGTLYLLKVGDFKGTPILLLKPTSICEEEA